MEAPNPAPNPSGPQRTMPPPRPESGKPFECPHCRKWESISTDAYCGFCGRPLLEISTSPDPFVLISGITPERDLLVRNASPELVRAVIVARRPAAPRVLFDPPGPFEIPAGGETRVKARLDETSLPAEPREWKLGYVCLVDDDPRKVFPIEMTVRLGPRPQIFTPAIQFGEFREGTLCEKNLEVGNGGGTPLRIDRIVPEGSSRLLLSGSPTFPIRVQPGERVSIPVVWNTQIAESAKDASGAGFRLHFGNLGNGAETVFVPARARLFQYRLEFDRPSVHLPRALSKQDSIERVCLENRGTIDVEISNVEPDQPWIEVATLSKSFTLLCPESLRAGRADYSSGAGGTFAFDVICHPQQLPQGTHKGQITVWPVGHDKITLPVEIDVITPTEYPEYVGIDFGTTNSVIAYVNQKDNSIELVEITPAGGPPSALIPSVLTFINGPASYKIGYEARNQADTAPHLAVRSIKRVMGYDHERKFFDRTFSPEELASLIIKKLVELAEARLLETTETYYDIRKAIVTVPANFFDLQIRGVLQACALAGLDTEEERVRLAGQALRENLGREVNSGIILDEPSAAVLYYLSHLEETKQSSDLIQEIDREGGLNLLVFDYGGGTLDVSIANVIRLEEGAFGLRVLANMGNNGIGGDTLDLLLMRELLTRARAEFRELDAELIRMSFKDLLARRNKEGWSAAAWSRILGARAAWKDLAEAAKIDLSASDSVLVEVRPDLLLYRTGGELQCAPNPFLSEVSRSELDTLFEGPLRASEALINSALELASLTRQDVHYILHTGRQSLLPNIRNRVRAMFPDLSPGREILDEQHLKVCVAKGAALYGLMRGSIPDPSAGVHFLQEGRRLPHSYGIEKPAGLVRRELDEIIPRGATYPTSVERNLDDRVSRAGWVSLKFYQNLGSAKNIARNPDIRLIGQTNVHVSGDGKPKCQVRFLIDANRKLEVYVNDLEVEITPVRLHGEEGWNG